MSTRLRALGAVAAVALLASGCAAGTHPGAAAVVGKTEISVGDVDKTSRAVSAALGQNYPSQSALNELVGNAIAAQVRQEKSISVSDAEIAAAATKVAPSEQAYQKLIADPVARDFLNQLSATVITTIKLGGGTGIDDPNLQSKQPQGAAALKEAAKDIKVDISPRFGQWNDGALDASISGSLSDESPQTKSKREAAQNAQNQGQGQG
ncbi:hypothetical protein AB0E69_40655 [Kribbella sp. NPDC026611]|uniref:hypothetical protein n=1 Tax=Kribbella sp. NPDC026611 TaxID=3154911 RepID=UPI0033FD113C